MSDLGSSGISNALFELEKQTNKILKAVGSKKIEEELIVLDSEQKLTNEEKNKEILVVFEDNLSWIIRIEKQKGRRTTCWKTKS